MPRVLDKNSAMRDVCLDFRALAGSGETDAGREMLMRYRRLMAAALAVLALSACVGVVVPVPLTSSATTQDTERNERR